MFSSKFMILDKKAMELCGYFSLLSEALDGNKEQEKFVDFGFDSSLFTVSIL